MSITPILTNGSGALDADRISTRPRTRKTAQEPLTLHMPARLLETAGPHHQAELFYLQKQIQAQTPMVIVLDDNSRIDGVIEWYDRNAIKVRGRNRTLIYKSAIKYMYKLGDQGRQTMAGA
jgi:sRNA-binding regulator protein Hfq